MSGSSLLAAAGAAIAPPVLLLGVAGLAVLSLGWVVRSPVAHREPDIQDCLF